MMDQELELLFFSRDAIWDAYGAIIRNLYLEMWNSCSIQINVSIVEAVSKFVPKKHIVKIVKGITILTADFVGAALDVVKIVLQML